ncbi:MAG: mannose-6-phosphate isomerase, partial [Marinilabilia sp.]
SFMILMCVEGSADILYRDEQTEPIQMGETILVPAELKEIRIKASDYCRILEIHMPHPDDGSKG